MISAPIRYLVILSTIICSIPSASSCAVPTFVSVRSQGVNTAKHLSGQVEHMYKPDVCTTYGIFSTSVEYTRAFQNDHITRCLFGTNRFCNTITISGSQTTDRSPNDWLADYFYLPVDFKSTLKFKPKVDNTIIDLNMYLGLDDWCPGLYLAAYAPLVHSRWNLDMNETVIKKGSKVHPAGYFTPQQLERGKLLDTFEQYAQGISPEPQTQLRNNNNQNDQITVNFGSLNNARISKGKLTKTRFADLRVILGYNWFSCDLIDYHVGAYAVIAAPTGNRPTGEFLFEAMIGNGHHTEYGGGLQGHYTLWRHYQANSCATLYGDISITHLAGTLQKRTFDLKGKPFSRYLLAHKLRAPDNRKLRGAQTIDPMTGAPTSPTTLATSQYANMVNPVANLTTLCVDVSIGVQVDFVAMVNVAHHCWDFDIGYNLWYRSCEKIKPFSNPLDNNTSWALKGDARMFGYAAVTDGGVPSLVNQGDAVGLSATQSQATIHAGTNSADTMTLRNTGIDKAQFAFAGTNDVTLLNAPGAAVTDRIKTSIQPIFLQASDIDLCEIQTKGLTSSLFGSISYTWPFEGSCAPYAGLGGRVEFAHNTNCLKQDDSTCPQCIRCALSQWGVWVRFGIAFE